MRCANWCLNTLRQFNIHSSSLSFSLSFCILLLLLLFIQIRSHCAQFHHLTSPSLPSPKCSKKVFSFFFWFRRNGIRSEDSLLLVECHSFVFVCRSHKNEKCSESQQLDHYFIKNWFFEHEMISVLSKMMVPSCIRFFFSLFSIYFGWKMSHEYKTQTTNTQIITRKHCSFVMCEKWEKNYW